MWRADLEHGRSRAASRWALREVLGRYLEVGAAEIELVTTANGKPALADPGAELRFNLSHSGELALVAVAHEREVGVDVQRIAPRRNLARLATRALDPNAAAAVRAAPAGRQVAVFHQAWARHEAQVKCLGSGLHRPRPPQPVAVADLDPGAGFAAAVAIAGEEMPPLRRFALAGGASPRPSSSPAHVGS